MKKNKLKVCIFGSTSHISKGLISNFLKNGEPTLHLYTRSADKLRCHLESAHKTGDKSFVIHDGYNDFLKGSYDVIINCVGVGSPNKLQGNHSEHFVVIEKYDNLIIRYLLKNPATSYISFSSGAVYGGGFSSAVSENTLNSILVNHVSAENYYSIAKFYSETKHRSFKNLKILDLRIFSYFSRHIDFKDGYFINDVMNCILNKKVLITDSVNIIRDYVHPEDLFFLILKCMDAGMINTAFDVTSAKPVGKREILDYFSSNYGLKYEQRRSFNSVSAAGSKNMYYSKYNKALEIGYKPKFNSMDTIEQESKHILKERYSTHVMLARKKI